MIMVKLRNSALCKLISFFLLYWHQIEQSFRYVICCSIFQLCLCQFDKKIITRHCFILLQILQDWLKSGRTTFLFFIHFLVVGQAYAVNVMEEYVLKGNSAIVKCHIPSFVSDFVTVSAWILDETDEVYPTTDYGKIYLQKSILFSFYTIPIQHLVHLLREVIRFRSFSK